MLDLPNSAGKKPVLQNLLLSLFVVLNVALWVFFGYFILVNTLLKDSTLVAVAPVKFGSSQPIVFTSSIENSTPAFTIQFKIGSVEKQIAPSLINFKLNTDKAYSYGKGSDIISVWSSALDNIQSPNQVLPEVSVDPYLLLAEFGISLSSNPEDAVRIINQKILNCHTGKYYANLDMNAFKNEINKDVGNSWVDLNLDSFLLGNQLDLQYKNCNKYTTIAPTVLSIINKGLETNVFKLEDVAIDVDGSLIIANNSNFVSKLRDIASEHYLPAQMGQYKDKGDSVWLLSNYVKGKELNLEETLLSIESFLSNYSKPQTSLAQTFSPVLEDVLPTEISGKKVYDFTQVVAQGKTRIDIIRNGANNASLVYAQYGVEAIDDVIVPAQSRFSYIETIKPQPRGRMANGSPISGGICNATTTIYRAALEAGFQITERSPHGFYVASYEWGYPLNIVDAAYYTNPKLDLAFINDFDAPILLDTEITRPGDGWQYHTITIRTAANISKRQVEFKDWKTYNVYSAKRFTGEFTRVVKDSVGQVIRQDTFVSRYYR